MEWFARDLLRELRLAGSHEEMAGGWAVSQKRVTAAEDELTVLESTAPDEAGRTRARSLRDAFRHARARMQLLVAPGQHDTWALDLDTLMIEMEGVLRPTASVATTRVRRDPRQAYRHPHRTHQRPRPRRPVRQVDHVAQQRERRLVGQLG